MNSTDVSAQTGSEGVLTGTGQRIAGRSHLLAFCAALTAFLLYANTLDHEYVFDDIALIEQDGRVQSGIAGIPDILLTPYREQTAGAYRPLPLIMYAVEWQLAPGDPRLGHWVNVLLYVGSAYLLFFMLRRLLPGYGWEAPFVGTLLFVTHPVHTEVIANIKGRDEILALFFVLLALWFLIRYLESDSPHLLGFGMLCHLLALLSRESAVTFVAVVPVYLLIFPRLDRKRILRLTCCFGLVTAIYFLIRIAVVGSVTGSYPVSAVANVLEVIPDRLDQVGTAIFVLGKYVEKLFFPHPLISDYSYNTIPAVAWTYHGVALWAMVYLALFILAISNIRKNRAFSFGILFFLITISVYSNLLVRIGALFAERFLFIPSLGFSLAIVGFLFVKRSGTGADASGEDSAWNLHFKKLALIVSAVVLLLFCYKTVSRNLDWRTNMTLFSADARTAPNNARLNLFLGNTLLRNAESSADVPALREESLREARSAFEDSLEILPRYTDAHVGVALVDTAVGHLTEAAERLEAIVRAEADEPFVSEKRTPGQIWNLLGIIYLRKGEERQKAIQSFEEALRGDYREDDAYKNLGSLYLESENFPSAIAVFQEALEGAPNDPVLLDGIAEAYRRSGDLTRASEYSERARRIRK